MYIPALAIRLYYFYAHPVFRQYMLNYIAPLYDNYHVWVTNQIMKFMLHETSLIESIKVEVMYIKAARLIYLTDSERRAGYMRNTAGAAYQAACKRRFAAAQVTYKLDNFAAPKPTPDIFTEFFRLL